MVEAERKYVGRWDVAQATETEGTKHIYGPHDSTIICQIRHQLESPVRCRLIWLKFILRSSEQTKPNLSSLDKMSSVSKAGPPFLHAKRIMVLGMQFMEEAVLNLNSISSLNSSMEKMSLRNMTRERGELPPGEK